MIYIELIGLVFCGLFLYQSFAGGIDAITNKIQRPWLKLTMQILLKTVMLTFLIAGIISAAIVAIAFSYSPKKKD
ncbi:MAG: hypothetical protein WCK67_08580 [bacterium]